MAQNLGSTAGFSVGTDLTSEIEMISVPGVISFQTIIMHVNMIPI